MATPHDTRPPVRQPRRPARPYAPARWPRRQTRWYDAARHRRRWFGPVSVILLLFGVFATGAGLGQASAGPWAWLSGGSKPPPRSFPVLAPSRPVTLVVRSIKVRAPVQRVGLAADGSIAVPDVADHNRVGWYDRGPTPGQFGPAIMVGHVDTKTGPSVFHDLIRLRPGARIEVTRADRSTAIFEVNSVEHFAKGDLPAQRVYGDFSRPQLRLITCGGDWLGGSVGYSDNVVAFASLIGSRRF